MDQRQGHWRWPLALALVDAPMGPVGLIMAFQRVPSGAGW
jgi:hypothetical protein